ncbi:Ig-like domain-containing protein, partial [Flavobacteriaceae bacterium]|nr:Ig-like domain-containing protein [Flavobacteriaceae bacterium]
MTTISNTKNKRHSFKITLLSFLISVFTYAQTTVEFTHSDGDGVISNSDVVTVTATFSEAISPTPTISLTGIISDANMSPTNSASVWTYSWIVSTTVNSTTASVKAINTSSVNYSGSESLTFVINDAPEVISQVQATKQNTARTIYLLGNDPEQESISYTIATQPSYGTVSLTVNQAVYTPDNDYVGIDSFSYTATDGTLTSASATVSLTVFYKHLSAPQQLGETLLGENNSDYFGNAVAMSQDGSIIAVGAKNADINTINDSGELKVYQKTVTASSSVVSWTQLGSSISGPQYSYYGRAVAMSLDGYTLITNNRVYRYSNGDWVQLGSDLSYTPSDYNSLSMNVDGTVVAVATNDYVQAYRFTNGEWTIKGSAIHREASSDYSIAIALSLDGNVLAIGAYQNDGGGNDSGHVRVFGYTLSAGWTQWGDDLDGSSASNYFGRAVAI